MTEDKKDSSSGSVRKGEDKKSELEILKKKADEYLNGWKRAKADYINFKKETEKNQKEIISYANAALIAELLPIFDNLKLALSHMPEDIKTSQWAKGLGHVKSQFDEFFKQLGIEEVKTVGEKFNPEFHEAVELAEKEGFEDNTIFEQIKSGYTLHGKLLSPAKVKIAKKNNK